MSDVNADRFNTVKFYLTSARNTRQLLLNNQIKMSHDQFMTQHPDVSLFKNSSIFEVRVHTFDLCFSLFEKNLSNTMH